MLLLVISTAQISYRATLFSYLDGIDYLNAVQGIGPALDYSP